MFDGAYYAKLAECTNSSFQAAEENLIFQNFKLHITDKKQAYIIIC